MVEYDAAVSVRNYKQDRVAIDAILLALSAICRMLVLDRVFGARYFRDVPLLKSIVVGVNQDNYDLEVDLQ